MHFVQAVDYDLDKAREVLNENGAYWSFNRFQIGVYMLFISALYRFIYIFLAPWERQRVLDFEFALHLHSTDFPTLVNHLNLPKSKIPELVNFYYIWNKSPRQRVWKKRNRTTYGV